MVRVPVVPQEMPLGHDSAEELRRSIDALADDEEDGASVEGPETSEDSGRDDRVGAIVEGQEDTAAGAPAEVRARADE
jgi:hypothetical protein